jgi:hypothetical protein
MTSLIVHRRVAHGGPSLFAALHFRREIATASRTGIGVTCGFCEPFSAWSLSLTERRHG